MGNSQSRPAEVEVPRKPQNRLSKPRTNSSTSNLLSSSAPAAAVRRNSQLVLPSAAPVEKRQSLVAPENEVVESRSRRNSTSTRQRLRDQFFRSRSSDGRGRSRTSSVTTESEVARDAVIARWSHAGLPSGSLRADEVLKLPDLDSRTTRPTSRRASTTYTGFSHHASRLSLVAEANTPEPNMEEATRRLEQLQAAERALTERSNSDASMIPIRRRSMLMTPGVATRRDSNGELLYESFPVSRRLSAAGTIGSKRSSWFDPSNPGLSSFTELPALEPPRFLQVMAQNEEAPRAVTPSEQVVHLGAYKPGTLRITNADSSNRDDVSTHEDTPKDLSLKIPADPLKPEVFESPKSIESAREYQPDLETLSPFSFQKSRSPSPQLQPTSKNSALEDDLFAADELSPGIVIGSPEHALRILDGSAISGVSKPSIERSQTSPVQVPSSYGSLNNTMQSSKDYKPLTKNDSGYSSNVSLRSFKAQAEARAAAAKSNGTDASEETSKRKGETSQSNKGDELSLPLRSHPVSLASVNAPLPLPDKLEEKLDVAHASAIHAADANMHWKGKSSLNISRKNSNSSPGDNETPANSASNKSSGSILRRLTKSRPASQPVITVSSNHELDTKLIPPISASASAHLEQRHMECPTLPHTYKSVSRTNSRETLTTIFSAADTAEIAAANSGQKAVASASTYSGNLRASQMGYSIMQEDAKLKAIQRRTARESQAQIDFETHITSFGTVSESLGASPYDLAVSAMAPRKRSQSFQYPPTGGFTNANRSHSSNDLAPHNIRTPQPGARKGMSANTAAQLARDKSRDREVGRRMSMEKLRDDRSALPSNRMAMRTSMTPNNSPSVGVPIRSPRAHRRQSSGGPITTRATPPPPVTMSAYRKSLPAQSPSPTATRSTGINQLNGSFPQSGPWVPQRPQASRYQSTNAVPLSHYEVQIQPMRRPQSTRPAMERQFPPDMNTQNRGTHNYSFYPNTSGGQHYTRPEAQQYNSGYGVGSSAGARNTWAPRNVDAGTMFGDVPVMIRG